MGSWVPDGIFDHVFSFAAIYHLEKSDQCATGLQLVEKLRIGGKAYFGWNQGTVMSNLEWNECFNVEGRGRVEVEIDAVEDAFLFPANPEDTSETCFLFQAP